MIISNEKSFWITNRFGEKLEALLRKPDKPGQCSSILFLSGLGMDLHEDENSFDEISQLLVTNNFLTLQFSFAGRGKSAGNYEKMTFEHQARQIEDVLYWLQNYDDVDKKHIGIVAQSCGAPSTLLTTISGVKSVFFISGEFNTYANLKRKFIERHTYNPTDISIYPFSNGTKINLNKTFWENLSQYKEMECVKKFNLPVFIAQGTADDYVSPIDAHHAFKLFPNQQKQIKLYPNGDHGLGNPPNVRKELLQNIVQWFTSTV